MAVSMYTVCVPVLLKGLKGLRTVLDKAAKHAEAKNIDPNAFLQARLYPDMFPLVRQVQLASDFAKGGAARVAGQEPPAWEDTETSFADLMARIDKTVDFLNSLKASEIDGSEERQVSLTRRGETHTFSGQVYLLEQAVPNFWFHTTTAYNILRHNGVEVGKKDFLAMS